jgi:hypothetical protein
MTRWDHDPWHRRAGRSRPGSWPHTSTVHRVGLTVTEACRLLDPPIPRRTLERLVANLAPIGVRRTSGRPASVYAANDLYRAHAEWVVGKSKWRVTEISRDESGG